MSRAVLVALILLFSAVTTWSFEVNHDTSWYLISTLWWLEGIPIYVEISELNPPLAFYLYAPPVFIAKVLGTDPTVMVRLYIFLIAAISTAWGDRLMRLDGRLTPSQLTIMTTAVAIGFVIVPFGALAQREHLMLLFAWPYVVSMIVSDDIISRKQKISIGLFSSLGLALKPIFLLIPLLLTLVRVASTRRFAAALGVQNITILGFCGAYVILSYLLHPTYFTEVIPKTLLLYGAYKSELAIVFGRSRNLSILFVVIFLGVYFSPKTRINPYIYCCAAATLAAFLFYNIQSKGWAYQLLPFRFFLWMFATVAVVALYTEAKQKISGVVFGLFAILMILAPPLLRGPYMTSYIDGLGQFFQCKTGNRTFQVFGSNVSRSYPMANKAGALPAVRTPTLWLFPGIIHRLANDIDAEERAMLNNVLDDYTESIIDDLLRVKPQLLIFDDREKKAYYHDVRFDYLEHFMKYERFDAFWSNYKHVTRYSTFEIYHRDGC
jgi:hypothetical protein